MQSPQAQQAAREPRQDQRATPVATPKTHKMETLMLETDVHRFFDGQKNFENVAKLKVRVEAILQK